MAMSITVEEASAQFSDLLVQVSQGEEITILREGHVIARLLPPELEPRVPGTALGMITIAPDFDDPLPDDLLVAFES
jgi:antitoxin (DNA-binding transcriptional repressor) of toxin-antitoxin stability system